MLRVAQRLETEGLLQMPGEPLGCTAEERADQEADKPSSTVQPASASNGKVISGGDSWPISP